MARSGEATTEESNVFHRVLPADPGSIGDLRRSLAAFARIAGASEAVVIDVQLAVSEAATNCVLHAFVDREPGEIRVMARVERDRLRVIVCDDGRGMLPRSDSPGIGLGLPTIGQLTASFDVRA